MAEWDLLDPMPSPESDDQFDNENRVSGNAKSRREFKSRVCMAEWDLLDPIPSPESDDQFDMKIVWAEMPNLDGNSKVEFAWQNEIY